MLQYICDRMNEPKSHKWNWRKKEKRKKLIQIKTYTFLSLFKQRISGFTNTHRHTPTTLADRRHCLFHGSSHWSLNHLDNLTLTVLWFTKSAFRNSVLSSCNYKPGNNISLKRSWPVKCRMPGAANLLFSKILNFIS